MQVSLVVCLLAALVCTDCVDAHVEKVFGILNRLLNEREKEAKSTIDTHDGEEQKRAMEDLRKVREVQTRMAKNADELQPVLHEFLIQLEHALGVDRMSEDFIEQGIESTCNIGEIYMPEGYKSSFDEGFKRWQEMFPDVCEALKFKYGSVHGEL